MKKPTGYFSKPATRSESRAQQGSSGPCQNASEVLREGLRMVERREAQDEMPLAALRDAAKAGIADIEAGNFSSFDSADRLGQHLATLTSRPLLR